MYYICRSLRHQCPLVRHSRLMWNFAVIPVRFWWSGVQIHWGVKILNMTQESLLLDYTKEVLMLRGNIIKKSLCYFTTFTFIIFHICSFGLMFRMATSPLARAPQFIPILWLNFYLICNEILSCDVQSGSEITASCKTCLHHVENVTPGWIRTPVHVHQSPTL